LLLLVTVLLGQSAFAQNWPQWRGPQGSGISDEKNLPSEWSADKNIRRQWSGATESF
jgi:hypothetical protein